MPSSENGESDLRTFEEYGPGYRSELVAQHNQRTALADAAFFVPYISSARRILDCGCGRGSITIDFAELLPAAEVIGCDIGREVLAQAAADASRRGVENVRFETASVYDLPFADESFDAVFAHAVLQHLAEPDRAVRELFRVLRPGGAIGLRDDDRGSMVIAPETPGILEALAVMDWYLVDSGGDLHAGRRHKERLVRAGFSDIVCSASCEADGTQAETAARGRLAAQAFRLNLGERAVARGRIAAEDRERLAQACESWGDSPSAFDCITWCEAVAIKPDRHG